MAHTIDCVCRNVKSWFKSWVFSFTFQAYILPHILLAKHLEHSNSISRSEKNKKNFIRSIQDFFDINQAYRCNLLKGIDNKTIRNFLIKLLSRAF
jgi:hypothetical protein